MNRRPQDLVPEAAIDRFTRDWHAVTGSRCAERALVAVSGGADSSALLLLFAALAPAMQQPHAATVDHGLRAASSTEAGRVADLARACGIPHAILVGPLPERVGATANLSARARALRYELLERHAEAVEARWIVTAHHADDQLETLVMRINRGSGVRGLSGVRAIGEVAIRPLLNWRRSELAAIVAACRVTAVNDPSNVDERFDRARLRKKLADADWLDPLGAARSAAALGDADEAVEWAMEHLLAEHCRFGKGQAMTRALLLPREFQRRLVERCLAHVDPDIGPRGREIDEAVRRLNGMEGGTLGRVRYGWAAAAGTGTMPWWTFEEAPPRRSAG